MPVDILKHNNGTVHYHSYGETHPCQGNYIDIAAKERDHKKGADDADGNGSGDHWDAGNIPEKQEKNNNSQGGAQKDVLADPANGCIDIIGGIINLFEFQASLGKIILIEVLYGLFQSRHNGQHIGARCLNNLENKDLVIMVPDNYRLIAKS